MDDRKLRKLLKIFEDGTDIEQVLFDSDDPFLLYNLSSARANLISWYDFDPEGTTLEIGAECGALTSFLQTRTASVTAIEKDPDNCEVLRERFRGCDNVNVICGGMEDVPDSDKFDYLILTGSDVDEELIADAKAHLKPGGTIFAAVDNRYGNMSREDLCEGISFARLNKIVKSSGFGSGKLFYPYPDYRFPLQIFTDERLPLEDELLPGKDTFAVEAAEGGVYGCYARSYLAVLTDNKAVSYPAYVKFNSLRRPDLRINTALYGEEDFMRQAVKTAADKNAEKKLLEIYENYNKLSSAYVSVRPVECREKDDGSIEFPFVKGRSLLSGLNLRNCSADELAGALEGLFEKLFDYKGKAQAFVVTPKFTALFPGCCPGSDEKAYPVINIDSNIDNFIETDEGIVCIDYEWVADFPVPVDYVKYRTLLYFYTKNQALLRDVIERKDLYGRFALGDREQLYQEMEDRFQEYVHGEGRRYIFTDRYELYPEEEKDKSQDEIDRLNRTVADKEAEITSLKEQVAAQQELINDISRAVRDPAFALKKFRIRSERKKEEHRVEREREKQHKERKEHYDEVYALNSEILDFYKSRHGDYEPAVDVHQVPYEDWIEFVESHYTCDETFEYNPKISVIVPVYNCPDKFLIPCIESVLGQIYTNIELCLSDDNSPDEHVRETMRKYENDPRVKCVYRKENGHISLNSNSAIEVADGEFIAFLDCDDTLSPNALYEVVKAINEAKKKGIDLDFIYSDEDKIDDEGKNRHMPHFKPDWSPDTMMSIMYTCHLGVYRKTLGDKTGWLREGFEGSQDYDFVLRLTELTTPEKICHIPKILYHWREHAGSTALNVGSKPYFHEASRKAKVEALKRRGYHGRVELVGFTSQWRIVYDSVDLPLVSIIIPSKDNYEYLDRCISSLNRSTTYRNFEIIVVDNGSSEENKIKYGELIGSVRGKYIYEKSEFNFSKMCNTGARAASGQYLLFLNDDIEIRDGLWLQRMVGHAELPYIGAVGAKLMYPEDDLIQHCGVINLRKAGPAHAFIRMNDHSIPYFWRTEIEYNWLAVTAACLLVNKEKFNQVGGFNEDFAVAFNDVDLCFKLYEAGYYNVVRADAVLIHYESVSRGYDNYDEAKMERLINEREKLYSMHPDLRGRDPFFNPNLTGRLAAFVCDNILTEPEDD